MIEWLHYTACGELSWDFDIQHQEKFPLISVDLCHQMSKVFQRTNEVDYHYSLFFLSDHSNKTGQNSWVLTMVIQLCLSQKVSQVWHGKREVKEFVCQLGAGGQGNISIREHISRDEVEIAFLSYFRPQNELILKPFISAFSTHLRPHELLVAPTTTSVAPKSCSWKHIL